jgi:hypothetical protein
MLTGCYITDFDSHKINKSLNFALFPLRARKDDGVRHSDLSKLILTCFKQANQSGESCHCYGKLGWMPPWPPISN